MTCEKFEIESLSVWNFLQKIFIINTSFNMEKRSDMESFASVFSRDLHFVKMNVSEYFDGFFDLANF